MALISLLQLCAFVFMFILSFFIFVPISLSQENLSGHCPLYTDGEWRFNDTSHAVLLWIKNWGHQSLCNFNIFMGMTSMIITFLQVVQISCGILRKSQPTFLPTFADFLLSLINVFLFFIASLILSLGFEKFCSLLTMDPSSLEQCSDAETANIKIMPVMYNNIHLEGFYSHLKFAQFGIWSSWLMWVIICILNSLKLYHVHNYVGGGQPFHSSLTRETEKLMETVQAARNMPF